MKKNQEEMNIADNPLYHDTWKLLKKYRDVLSGLDAVVPRTSATMAAAFSLVIPVISTSTPNF